MKSTSPAINLGSGSAWSSLGEAGFSDARHVSGADLMRRYFTGRSDNLRPSSGEDFLVAMVRNIALSIR